jgi:hypothetical protein
MNDLPYALYNPFANRDYGLDWWRQHGDLRRSAVEAEEVAEESYGKMEMCVCIAGTSM